MAILIAFLSFLATAAGGVGALRLRHRLHPVMAFAAGVVIATALAELQPEARDLLGEGASPILPGAAAVVGFLLFSVIDAFVHRSSWEHEHPPLEDPHRPHEHVPRSIDLTRALGLVGPAGLIVHSVLDGVAIGLAFRASAEVGAIVAVAVVAHDFADGMNVVTLALTEDAGVGPARVLLALDALAPIAGAALGSVVALDGPGLGLLLGVFSGVFIAIGAGHLLPEAQHQRPGAAPMLVVLCALGAALPIAVRMLAG